MYEGCLESIQPFWISRLLIAWPRCILAASQRKPDCASVNSHSPMGLVSQQWDSVDWACVICDRPIHNDWASRTASSRQCACPFCNSHAGFLGAKLHHPSLSVRLQPTFGSLQLLGFPKAYDGHTVHKLSQRRLTANWLALRKSDCSLMHSRVSSN
jgi:hypothetical protein